LLWESWSSPCKVSSPSKDTKTPSFLHNFRYTADGRLDSRFLGRDRLGVTEQPEYDPLLANVMGPYAAALYDCVGETLRKTMMANPHLKIFVANGYYDLGTPYFASESTFDYLGLDESLRGNVTMSYYEAGHMMYIHMPSLAEIKRDLAEFIRGAMPE
jgi:hypothetical protein